MRKLVFVRFLATGGTEALIGKRVNPWRKSEWRSERGSQNNHLFNGALMAIDDLAAPGEMTEAASDGAAVRSKN